MNGKKKCWAFALAVLLGLLLCSVATAAGEVTITGMITGYSVESDDGTLYDIGDTEKGNELAEYTGMRVRVTGTLEEDDYGKVIIVDSYTVLEESPNKEQTEESGQTSEQ